MNIRRGFAAFFLLVQAWACRAEKIEIVWPTPNTAYLEGRAFGEFVQPTASGEVESGLYGCVRSSGAQFHEGIDLKPVKRDRRGEPTDPIFAVMNGVVRYINRTPGDSSYGRYIVLEHPQATPGVYTLYAHLSEIASGLKQGAEVEKGQTIGIMGRSASGQAIPKDRAHLHFEIGLWATRDFQRWYDSKKFGNKNDHGIWNGMNLLGIDPHEFYQRHRAGRVDGFAQYFAQMTAAVRVRVATRMTPDFIQRYPALLQSPLPEGSEICGWDIAVNENGVPFLWTPLKAESVAGLDRGESRILEVAEGALRHHRCRSLVVSKRGGYVVGRDLETLLQLLFGFR